MRIERLDIDGFGQFFGEEVGPFDRPLVMISGANEAGKSTILAFIRTVLFGFPSRRNQYYPPLAGGTHGGSLTISLENGGRYRIQRFAGPRGGVVTITDSDGAPLDGASLGALVGPATRGLFEKVFAFGLDELQDLASLNGDEVSGRIYGAGMGAANLPDVMKRLEDRKREIFRGGNKHEIAQVLTSLEEVERQLAEVAGHAAEYGRLTVRQGEIERELKEITGQQAQIGGRVRELDRASSALDELWPLRQVDRDLAELPPFDRFPENATSRLEVLEGQVRAAGQELSAAEESLTRAEAAAARPIPHEELLSEADAVERIRRGRGSFDESVRDLPERITEVRTQAESLASTLKELGPDWDEDRLEAFDVSMEARDQVGQWRGRLAEAGSLVRERTADQSRAVVSQREADEARQSAETALAEAEKPPFEASELEERRTALRTSRSRHTDLVQARQRRGELEAELRHLEEQSGTEATPNGGLPIMPLVLFLVGAGALVAGLVMEAQQIALFLGAALLAVAAFLFAGQRARSRPAGEVASGRAGGLKERVGAAAEAEAAAETALREAAAILDVGLPDADALDQAEGELGAAAAALLAREEVVGRLAGAVNLADSAASRAVDAAATLKKSIGEQAAAGQEWARWLADHMLTDTLTPETVVELFGRVETARSERRQLLSLRDRSQAIRTDIDEYRALVEPLAAAHMAGPVADDPRRVAAIADRLVERYDEARVQSDQRGRDRTAAGEARRLVTRRRDQAGSLAEELHALLKAGGATDGEDLRTRAGQHASRTRLEELRREHRQRLERLAGQGMTVEDLTSSLEKTSPEAILEEREQIKIDVDEADARRSEREQDRGSVRTRLQQLAGDDEASELRGRRAVLVEQLRAHAEKWSQLAIARALLDRARLKYERERQPGVMRHAEGFFGSVTGGRYERLRAPLGEQTVKVTGADGLEKEPDQLSRGTREQLYLALRFGLIREYGGHAEPLPVVIDDALVNFDPERARLAAAALIELSTTNQVLVFTCHPSTVELFTEAGRDTQVIQLGGDASSTPSQARLV